MHLNIILINFILINNVLILSRKQLYSNIRKGILHEQDAEYAFYSNKNMIYKLLNILKKINYK